MGDNGNDKDKKSGDDKKSDITSEQIVAAIRTLATNVKSLVDGQAAVHGRLEALESGGPGKGDERQEKIPDGKTLSDLSTAELEAMDPKELMQLVVDEIREKEVKPLMEKLEEVTSAQTRSDVSAQVKQAQADYSDFDQWGEEMRAELKKNPSLDVDDAYHLARKNHPEKAKTIDEKADEEAREAAKEKEGEEEEDQSFGGLLPTSGISTKAEKMTQKQAVADAWEKTMGPVEKQFGP